MRSESSLEDGEFNSISDKLSSVDSSGILFKILRSELGSSDNDEGLRLSLVSSGHFGVQLSDSTVKGSASEFLVKSMVTEF